MSIVAPDHLHYFLPYQQDWIDSEEPVVLGEKSRRIGWTYASSYRAVERRASKTRDYGSLYFTSIDRTASREFIDYCKRWCEVFNAVAVESEGEEVIDNQQMTMQILTFENGRKIVAGSSNPNFYRSKGGDADADEFAFHRDGRKLLTAMQATAIPWGHQIRLWGTHNGEGSYFNSLVKQAKEYEAYLAGGGEPRAYQKGKFRARVQSVTILDAVDQGLVEKILKLPARDDRARQEWLDDIRATAPDQDAWNEEYLCRPSSEQAALLSYDLIAGCERSAEELKLAIEPAELQGLGGDGPLYAGMDVGRTRDLTVFWVLRKVGDVFETRLIRPFADTPFHLQEDFLHLLMAVAGVKRLCIDRTGIGMQMAERAIMRYGAHRVEGVNFSAPVKSELAIPLKRLFEDKLVRVPADPEVRESLHKVRKIVTAAGNVRFDAAHDEKGHADEFWGLALAYHAADVKQGPVRAPVSQLPEALAGL